MNSEKKGSFLVLVAVLLWSLTGVIIKTVQASTVWIILIRSVVGALCLLPFLFKEKLYPLKRAFIAGIFMAIFCLSVTLTTKLSSAAMAVSMQYAAPVYVIGYHFYKSRTFDFRRVLVFFLLLVGILCNVVDSFRSANFLAIFSGIIVGVSFVFYSVSLQQIETGSPLGIVSFTNIICSLFYLILLPLDFTPIPTSGKDILLLCLTGALISGLSYALYGAGLKEIPIEKAMIIAALEPILNPIWVFLGTKEIPPLLTLIGLFLILSGTVADIFLGRKEKKSRSEHVI